MLKVMIADDEEKVCRLIYKLVDWESLDMEVVKIVHDGIEAARWLEECELDILITDIRMPGYDGLELVQRGRAIRPGMKFIIISGYSHFEYAHTAIRFGVSEYLLKPIKEDELNHILGQIRDSYQTRQDAMLSEQKQQQDIRKDIEKLRSSAFYELLISGSSSKGMTMAELNQEYHFDFRAGAFQVVLIKLDFNGTGSQCNLKFIEEKIRQMMEKELAGDCYECVGYFNRDQYYWVLNYPEEGQKNMRRQLKAILAKLLMLETIFAETQITFGIGKVVMNPEELAVSLKYAALAIEQRLIPGTQKFIEGEEFRDGDLADSELFYTSNKMLTAAFEQMNVYEVREGLRYLKEGLIKRRGTTGHEIVQMTKEVCNLYLYSMRKQQLPVAGGERFMSDFNDQVDSYGTIDQLFGFLMTTLTNSLEQSLESKQLEDKRPIRSAKKYIQENYMNSITLEEVSNHVGFNTTYFSSVFKKETGSTFLEYLSEVRMNEARELLKRTNMSIAAICEQVGYSDVKYFTKIFSKHSGLKPNEYRKLYS